MKGLGEAVQIAVVHLEQIIKCQGPKERHVFRAQSGIGWRNIEEGREGAAGRINSSPAGPETLVLALWRGLLTHISPGFCMTWGICVSACLVHNASLRPCRLLREAARGCKKNRLRTGVVPALPRNKTQEFWTSLAPSSFGSRQARQMF